MTVRVEATRKSGNLYVAGVFKYVQRSGNAYSNVKCLYLVLFFSFFFPFISIGSLRVGGIYSVLSSCTVQFSCAKGIVIENIPDSNMESNHPNNSNMFGVTPKCCNVRRYSK